MKIAISNIAWESSENDRVAEIMVARKIHGVEIAPTKVWPDLSIADNERVIDYRRWWEGRSIRIVALQSLLFGRPELNLFGNADVRRRMLDHLSAAIRIASLVGAKVLVFGSPKNRRMGDLAPLAAVDLAVEFFSDLATMAHASGVTVGLEANPATYGCDFVCTSQQALHLVKRVAHPGFRIHLDTAILAMTGEIFEEALGACCEYLVHVHVSEPMLGVVGEGGVDHTRMARALRSIGYEQWLSIEMRSGSRVDNTIAVESALEFVNRIYGDAVDRANANAHGS
jgi:sugar phosphate isomerase/epimerase